MEEMEANHIDMTNKKKDMAVTTLSNVSGLDMQNSEVYSKRYFNTGTCMCGG